MARARGQEGLRFQGIRSLLEKIMEPPSGVCKSTTGLATFYLTPGETADGWSLLIICFEICLFAFSSDPAAWWSIQWIKGSCPGNTPRTPPGGSGAAPAPPPAVLPVAGHGIRHGLYRGPDLKGVHSGRLRSGGGSPFLPSPPEGCPSPGKSPGQLPASQVVRGGPRPTEVFR